MGVVTKTAGSPVTAHGFPNARIPSPCGEDTESVYEPLR